MKLTTVFEDGTNDEVEPVHLEELRYDDDDDDDDEVEPVH